MVYIKQLNNSVSFKNTPESVNEQGSLRGKMKDRPYQYAINNKEHDSLRPSGVITKVKVNIENALNTPGYAYRGMKGDPDFNFFESQRVSRVPYYLGGLGLAAVAMCGKNSILPHVREANNAFVKKVLLGVLMYYAAKEAANAAIDIPVRIFRGVDLNRPYRKITSLREGNPMNLPNNKKPSNQNVFESTEFTRWDLLYKYDPTRKINETFDDLAKKFGVQKPLKDADSTLMSKIKKLIIMATSWKTMLSVPFVMTGLGLAQQESFEKADFRGLIKATGRLFKPSTPNRFLAWKCSFKHNFLIPIKDAFVDLWKGKTTASKILGRGAIIASVGMAVLANAIILNKTSLKPENNEIDGGKK